MCGRSTNKKASLKLFTRFNRHPVLLGITPSPNNGAMGSLYHLLTPSLLPSLPPPQTLHVQELEAARGVSESCPFPTDQETYNRRSFCEECVCWDECAENITNATIGEANQLLNLTADKSKLASYLHVALSPEVLQFFKRFWKSGNGLETRLVQTAAVTIISYKPLSDLNFARYAILYGSYMSPFGVYKPLI